MTDELKAWSEERAYERAKAEYVEKLDKIRAEIKDNRDEWIKGEDAEWHAYDRCLYIIDKYKAEGENEAFTEGKEE